MAKKNHYSSKIPQITFALLFALLLVLSFLVAKPFLISIISGALLAFIFFPVYTFFLKGLKNKSLTAFATTIVILLFIAIPILLMGNAMANETKNMAVSINQKLSKGELLPENCQDGNFICRTTDRINKELENPETVQQIKTVSNSVLGYTAEKIGEFLMSIPGIILNLAIALFTVFYFLRDGDKFLNIIKKIAPLKLIHQEELANQLKETTKALIYGTIIIAIVQGILAMIGFLIFGVPSPVWWGAVTIFFAIIPFIGAWIIWFPASIYLALIGYMQNQTSMIWKGVGLAIYGVLIVSTADNWLKPILVGGRAKVHPILILVGVLGGLSVFGFMGIILGPIVLALLQKIILIYAKEIEPYIKEQPGILGSFNHHVKKKKTKK